MLNSIFFCIFFYKKTLPLYIYYTTNYKYLSSLFGENSRIFSGVFFLGFSRIFCQCPSPYFVPPKRSCACPLNSRSCSPRTNVWLKELELGPGGGAKELRSSEQKLDIYIIILSHSNIIIHHRASLCQVFYPKLWCIFLGHKKREATHTRATSV